MDWYQEWFNEDYLALYPHRNEDEAEFQIRFIVEALSLKKNESVLDIGCGYGRHVFPLLKYGIKATGIDQSKTLIDLAKKRNTSAHFIYDDIKNFQSPELFDASICIFTSFGYDEKDETNKEYLKAVRKNLKPQGRFFLDYLNPDNVIKKLVPYEEKNVNGAIVKIEREIAGSNHKKNSFPQ